MVGETGCESQTSRNRRIFYPPPEDTASNFNTTEELNSKIVPDLELSQEPPTPTGFFYPNEEEDVQLLDIDLEYISNYQPRLSPEITCTTTPKSQMSMMSPKDGTFTRSVNVLHSSVSALRQHPSLTDKRAMRIHHQRSGHKPSRSTKTIGRVQTTGSPTLSRYFIPPTRLESIVYSTQLGQWAGYSESSEGEDEGFAAAKRRDNLGEDGECRQGFVSQQRLPSPSPLRKLPHIFHRRQPSPIFHHENTPRFPTSEQILQTSKRLHTVHYRLQQPALAETEFSRISSVPSSPSRAMPTSRALPTVQERGLSPTSIFIIDDDDESDIESTNESDNDTEDSGDVSNRPAAPTNKSRVAVLAKLPIATGPFADDSDSDPNAFVKPKKPRLNLLRIKQAIAQNAKDASDFQKSPARAEVPVSITRNLTDFQIQQKNNGVQQPTRSPNTQAVEARCVEAATTGATRTSGNVAGPQLGAQKTASRSITVLPVTDDRKTSLQTGESTRNRGSVEVARSSMSAHKSANRPGNQVHEKVEEQNTLPKQAFKRSGSHAVASATKKQKTTTAPIARPPRVDSLAALLEDLVPTEKAPIAPKKTPAPTTERSFGTPKLASMNVKKAPPVPLKVSSTSRSAIPTSPKDASIAPKSIPVTSKPAPITIESVASRNAPVPQKETTDTPKLPQVPKPAPKAPQAASSTSTVSSVSKATSDLPNTASASLKTTATTQAGPSNPKIIAIDPQTAATSQRTAPSTIQASPITHKETPVAQSAVAPQNEAQVTLKEIPSPAKRVPVPKEAPSISEKTSVTGEKTHISPEDLPSAREVNTVSPNNATSTPIEPVSAIASRKESPFFEYTVFQSTTPSIASASPTPSIQLGTYTDIDAANAQAEALHLAAAHQHPLVYDIQFSSWSKIPDPFDCLTYHGTFAPMEYPTRTSQLKIWVERHAASTYTDRMPSPKPYFLAKNVFILRLRRLVEAAEDNDSDTDDDDDDEDDDAMDTKEERQPLRIHQALPQGFAELYTTPDAANRAARRVQIEMSHEKEAENQDMDSKHQGMRMWQETNRRELLKKVVQLEKASMGCWESQFNGAGLGGDRFELVVERVRLSGPRNL